MNKIVLLIVMFMSLIGNAMADVTTIKGGDAFEGTSWTAVVVEGKVRAGEKTQRPRIVLYTDNIHKNFLGRVQITASIFLGDSYVCGDIKRGTVRVKARLGDKRLNTVHIKFKDSNSGHYITQPFTKVGIGGILDGKEIAFKYTDSCGTTQITTFNTTRIHAEAKGILTELLTKMNRK